ncbi:MAG: hypothetical protein RMA76_21800 [Deltaproteobacteria bacterium]|jgi:hypothetical protein
MAKEVISVRLDEDSVRALKAQAARLRLKEATYAATLLEAAVRSPSAAEEAAAPRLFERLLELEARLVQLQLAQAEAAQLSDRRLDEIRKQAFDYLGIAHDEDGGDEGRA